MEKEQRIQELKYWIKEYTTQELGGGVLAGWYLEQKIEEMEKELVELTS